MEIQIVCKYCDYKKVKIVYNQNFLASERCAKCGDSNLEVKDLSKTKIDSYKGCKPFPDKKDNSKEDSKEDSKKSSSEGDWPYDLMGVY